MQATRCRPIYCLSALGLIMMIASCAQPGFLFQEQRIKYELKEKDGVIYTTSGVDKKFPEPEKKNKGIEVKWGVIVQNNSTMPIEIKPSWAKIKISQKISSANCDSEPRPSEDLLKLPTSARAKIICVLFFDPEKFPELRTTDQWANIEIPYTRDAKELSITFQYKLKVEDFQQ